MQLVVIQKRIYEVRGQKVMLDFDLAELYEVQTRILNQAVKRNLDSFPNDFMFKLSSEEWQSLLLTIEKRAEEERKNLKSQNVISSWGGRRKLPYAFTEHGVTMLASILKSPRARKMNIAIVRTFIELKRFVIQYDNVLEQLHKLKERVGDHDIQLNQIYDVIENLLDGKAAQRNLGG